EDQFDSFDLQMFTIKERLVYEYNLPSNHFELHASELFSSSKGKKSLGRRLVLADCIELFRSVFVSIYPNSEFKVIFLAILKPELSPSINIKLWAYRMFLERIEMTLKKDYDTMGILIRDTEDPVQNIKKDLATRDLVKNIIYSGTKYVKFERIIPNTYFVKSKLSDGVQLSDITAYTLRRYLESKIYNEHPDDHMPEALFNYFISRKLSGYPNYMGKGFKIFPKIEFLRNIE
ncbi:MAG: DUF3800 domain-containing protein, partial [Promethearchaeota archaeon]